MPFVDIAASPLAPGVSPARIHYRGAGAGLPLVFLHGGWGYEIYPFGHQIDELSAQHQIVVPSRSGYGRSPAIDDLPPDFHHRAVDETLQVLDALGLQRPILWGHSDGAIIALLLGLKQPDRISAAIVEATHYFKRKPASRAFFEELLGAPESLSPGVAAVLVREHGDRWKRVVQLHSAAWLRIAEDAHSPQEDFYGGRLHELNVPALVVHGARDQRTEPGELDALRAALPRARFAVFEDGGHSPHSERATAAAVTDAAVEFLAGVAPAAGPVRR